MLLWSAREQPGLPLSPHMNLPVSIPDAPMVLWHRRNWREAKTFRLFSSLKTETLS